MSKLNAILCSDDTWSEYDEYGMRTDDIPANKIIKKLVDLVNSQQEAIEKLESKVWTADFIKKYRPALENLAEAADDKPTAKEIARAILDEPLDDKPESKNYKLVTESEPFDRVEYEKAKFVRDREKVRFAGFDTHRTVSLRIPKGMSIVEAIEEAYQDTIIHTDTDLQKALDEVEK